MIEKIGLAYSFYTGSHQRPLLQGNIEMSLAISEAMGKCL